MKIKYSIISRGTEKYNNRGYMAISFDDNNGYIINSNHGIEDLNVNSDTLVFKKKYSISNISISRFSLISRLLLERIELKDNILICGLGNVGFSLLIELLKRGYKNISIYSNSIANSLINIEKNFKVNINIINELSENYTTYIDTTGSSNVIEKMFEVAKPMSTIVILSTPRDEKFKISPLIINRKNLAIYGAHELFGLDLEYRKRIYNLILDENKKLENLLDEYVSIHPYSEKQINRIKEKKENFVDILKY